MTFRSNPFQLSLLKFNAEKVNDVEIASSFGVKLEQCLNETQIMLDALLAAYDQSVEMYRDAMQEAFDQSDDAYFKEADLKQHHLKAKNESVSQVCAWIEYLNGFWIRWRGRRVFVVST